MQAPEESIGVSLPPGTDYGVLAGTFAKWQSDCEHDSATGLFGRVMAEANYWRGRCEGQAETVAYLKARVEALEARERDRLYAPQWPPRREAPNFVVAAPQHPTLQAAAEGQG